MKNCIYLLILAAALACSPQVEITAGKLFPVQRARVIKKHFTSEDVRSLLGEPLSVRQLDGRRSQWRYFYRQETSKPALYVFSREKEILEHEVLLIFDGNLVEEVNVSSQTVP
jgi:outer membrane protein assembly factor BamE (lipoprotein component of BamABCDE complex)